MTKSLELLSGNCHVLVERVVPRLSWPDGRVSGGIGHPLTTLQYKTTHFYQPESSHRVQLSHDHYGLE